MTLAPPLVPAADLVAALRGPGHAVVDAAQWCPAWGLSLAALQALAPTWHDLPPDNYLRDGGRYRRRRHGCWVADAGTLTAVPHRPHWQPVEYNALHGGIERHFEPIDPHVAGSEAWRGLLRGLATVASDVAGERPWYVEAHQFRIDTTDGIGRPTPEGAHRDGVDFVAVFLVDRVGVKGGETRVFDADGPAGLRFTLSRAWTLLMLDDARVIHESTPIQPVDAGAPAWRDTLVVTLRRGGFQGPP
ncbi:MAG: 2OG-Fe dioxygenase family protein [Ideonella sp.]|nr:2OG-Fe dioxygenase family protein [Ideonella sp.]